MTNKNETKKGFYSKTPYCSLNARTVPRNLRDAFKDWCHQQGVSMQDGVVKLIKKALDNNTRLE